MSVAASLLVFGMSMHKSWGEREWLNPGLGVVVQHEQLRALAGYYRNSEGENSAFIGAGGEIPLGEHAGLTLNAALVSGYTPAPVLAPLVTIYYDVEPLRVHAAVLPEAVALFLEYRL